MNDIIKYIFLNDIKYSLNDIKIFFECYKNIFLMIIKNIFFEEYWKIYSLNDIKIYSLNDIKIFFEWYKNIFFE